MLLREVRQHNLAYRLATFDLFMSLAQIRGSDGFKFFSERASYLAFIYKLC